MKPEQKAEIEREIRGILRAAGAPYPLDTTFSTIRADPTGPTRQPPGILKKESPQSAITDSAETRSILKKETGGEPRKEPGKSVLKKETIAKVEQPEKGVLKKDSTFEPAKTEPERPTLRMDHETSRKDQGHTTEVKSVLKVTSTEVSEYDTKRGILKSRGPEQEHIMTQGILKSPPSESQEVLQSGQMDNEVNLRSSQGQVRESPSEEDSSSASGGPRRIKNEAIARRRHHRELRKQGER